MVEKISTLVIPVTSDNFTCDGIDKKFRFLIFLFVSLNTRHRRGKAGIYTGANGTFTKKLLNDGGFGKCFQTFLFIN